MIYKTEKVRPFGQGIGILLLDCLAPHIPGDVANATSYSYPVRYELVEGFTFSKLENKEKDAFAPLLEAAKKLQASGVKAITADCGFFALFQKEMADALDIPVFMSSLLQVPFISQIIGADNKVGIISAVGATLDDSAFLSAVGIERSSVVIRGLENKPYFHDFAILETGILDTEKIQGEVVETALEMVAQNPKIKAILLECSMMSSYSNAVQEATGLPVFDYITMIDYVYSCVVKKKFNGNM